MWFSKCVTHSKGSVYIGVLGMGMIVCAYILSRGIRLIGIRTWIWPLCHSLTWISFSFGGLRADLTFFTIFFTSYNTSTGLAFYIYKNQNEKNSLLKCLSFLGVNHVHNFCRTSTFCPLEACLPTVSIGRHAWHKFLCHYLFLSYPYTYICVCMWRSCALHVTVYF